MALNSQQAHNIQYFKQGYRSNFTHAFSKDTDCIAIATLNAVTESSKHDKT